MDFWHVLESLMCARRMGATPIARKMNRFRGINRFWLMMGLETSREAAENLVLMFIREALWPKMRYVIICLYMIWHIAGVIEDMAWGFKKHVGRQAIGTQGHDPRVKLTGARDPKVKLIKLMAARKPDRLLMGSDSGLQVCKHVPESMGHDEINLKGELSHMNAFYLFIKVCGKLVENWLWHLVSGDEPRRVSIRTSMSQAYNAAADACVKGSQVEKQVMLTWMQRDWNKIIEYPDGNPIAHVEAADSAKDAWDQLSTMSQRKHSSQQTVMKIHLMLVLLVMISCRALVQQLEPVYEETKEDGGACGYGGLAESPYASSIAAGIASLFWRGHDCGVCYDVTYTLASCKQEPVHVMITDKCPGGDFCGLNQIHFDINGTAFGDFAIPGRALDLRTIDQVCGNWKVIQNGYDEEAIELFKKMQENGIRHAVKCFHFLQWLVVSFACGIRHAVKCVARWLWDREHARCSFVNVEPFWLIDLYDHSYGRDVDMGSERETYSGDALVNIYVKCSSLPEEQEGLNRLGVPHIVSWNTLTARLSEKEFRLNALECFQPRQIEGISLGNLTFVCSLKACSNVEGCDWNRTVHDVMLRFPLSRYAEHGSYQEVGKCFEQMELEGISPYIATYLCGCCSTENVENGGDIHAQIAEQFWITDPRGHTLADLLGVCSQILDSDKGQQIHQDVRRKRFEDTFVGSKLAEMYVKCGHLKEDWEFFNEKPLRNVVTWTTLIGGCAEHSCGQEALKVFEKMQLEGMSSNAFTFVCSLKLCNSIGAVDTGQRLHSVVVTGRLENDIFIGNIVVDRYAKSNSFSEAQKVFDKLPACNIMYWNSLIVGYAENGLGEDSLKCFEQMQVEGMLPDVVALVCSPKVCDSTKDFDEARAIHEKIAQMGLEKDLFNGTCQYGSVLEKEALKCYKLMQMQLIRISVDGITYVSMLKACSNERVLKQGRELADMDAKYGSLGDAQEFFDKLPVRDVISWTILIFEYTEKFADAFTVKVTGFALCCKGEWSAWSDDPAVWSDGPAESKTVHKKSNIWSQESLLMHSQSKWSAGSEENRNGPQGKQRWSTRKFADAFTG